MKNSHGTGQIGCLIYLLVFGALLYVSYIYGSAQLNCFAMREQIHEMAKFVATSQHLDLDLVKKDIMKQAENLGITVSPKDIRITDGENEVTIEVYWETPLEFPYYTYILDFSVAAQQKKWL